jgi:mRNA interferase RelE/StbE
MATASGAYRLQFLPQAKQEWDQLDGSIKTQFAKVLLRSTGFRLVYRVQDDALVLLTIAVGKRDNSVGYDVAKPRLALTPAKTQP